MTSGSRQRWYFRWYWRLYAVLPLTGLALIVYYLTAARLDLVGLVKIPQVSVVLLLCAFHLQYRLWLIGPAMLFACGGMLAVAVGSIRGTLGSEGIVTHVFMTLMPILSMSFGAHFAAAPESWTQPILRSGIRLLFLFSTLSILLYAYFHYVTGQIAYFGFDSYLPVAAAWYLAKRQHRLLALSFGLVLLSGKRAPMVTMAAPLVVMATRSVLLLRWRNLLSITGVIVLIATALWAANSAGLLWRFDAIRNVDITDWDSLHLATSGRSHEVGGLVASRAESPFLWWTGGGFGGGYTLLDSSFQENVLPETHYYLHLALLTYVMVFGIPFTAILLLNLLLLGWRLRNHVEHFYVVGAVTMFVWSLFGAGILVEPAFWFFLGACTTLSARPLPTAAPPIVTQG
jgi:hypothetical protein